MIKLSYITSSSFSGSTLLAFLLNTHPDIFTVGEMTGWNYGMRNDFRCSCGAALSGCRFFQTIAEAFRERHLPFDYRDFGTEYRLAPNDRINGLLTGAPPRLRSSPAERLRDAVVRSVPAFSRRLRRQDEANLTFIRAALKHSGASVFVDGSKDPYRLRHLGRIPELDLRVVYLVRDPRGVAFSNITKQGWGAAFATQRWIQEQATIQRIAGEFAPILKVYYEDVCRAAESTLGVIYGFLGLARHPVPPDFKSMEHHILGNRMRLQEEGRITTDQRWRHALSPADQDLVSRTATGFVRRHPAHPVAETILHYLEER